VADIRQGGKTIIGEAFVVGSEPAQPIEVIINTNGITLEGFIEGFADTPAQVVLFPDVPRRKNDSLYRVVHVLREGRFRMEGLPPGEYHLIAIEDSGPPTTIHWDSEFFAKYEASSVGVAITEGKPAQGIRVPLVRK
jgi:hypothetical protein